MRRLLIIALCSICGSFWAVAQDGKLKELPKLQIAALIDAIQDEIYDNEFQDQYFPEGGPIGEVIENNKVRVNVYISSEIKDGIGKIIYKLMPYGEIIRRFRIGGDALIRLDGNPELGFPATQESRKTVYLSDEEVCRFRKGWLKSAFIVDLEPSERLLEAAIGRQKLRNNGYSVLEHLRRKPQNH